MGNDHPPPASARVDAVAGCNAYTNWYMQQLIRPAGFPLVEVVAHREFLSQKSHKVERCPVAKVYPGEIYCRAPGCFHTQYFKQPGSLNQHYRTKHGYAPPELPPGKKSHGRTFGDGLIAEAYQFYEQWRDSYNAEMLTERSKNNQALGGYTATPQLAQPVVAPATTPPVLSQSPTAQPLTPQQRQKRAYEEMNENKELESLPDSLRFDDSPLDSFRANPQPSAQANTAGPGPATMKRLKTGEQTGSGKTDGKDCEAAADTGSDKTGNKKDKAASKTDSPKTDAQKAKVASKTGSGKPDGGKAKVASKTGSGKPDGGKAKPAANTNNKKDAEKPLTDAEAEELQQKEQEDIIKYLIQWMDTEALEYVVKYQKRRASIKWPMHETMSAWGKIIWKPDIDTAHEKCRIPEDEDCPACTEDDVDCDGTYELCKLFRRFGDPNAAEFSDPRNPYDEDALHSAVDILNSKLMSKKAEKERDAMARKNKVAPEAQQE